MMITMQAANWVREGWELRFAVHEGVYHLENYPVRISHFAFTEDPRIREALATVVSGLLQRHMRRGAVPPHAMVLNWSRAHRICEGGTAEMIAACHVIEATTLAEVGGAISNHF
jgi:hypothetical protein